MKVIILKVCNAGRHETVVAKSEQSSSRNLPEDKNQVDSNESDTLSQIVMARKRIEGVNSSISNNFRITICE